MPELRLLLTTTMLIPTLLFTMNTPPAAATSYDSFGVGFGANELQPQTPHALQLASQANIDWIRLGLYWQDVEPNPGQTSRQTMRSLPVRAPTI